MWTAEKDPALRSDFTNLTLLAHRPATERLRARIVGSFADLPRLTERVVEPPVRAARPVWQPDRFFDLGFHLRHVALPPGATWRTLLDFAADFSADPLDRSRPLWQFVLVEGLPDGRAALLQKVHHTITDGVGGLRLSLALIDPLDGRPAPEERVITAEVPRHDDPIDRSSTVDAVLQAVADTTTQATEYAVHALKATLSLALRPGDWRHAACDALQLGHSIQRQMLVADRGKSELLARRSLARRFDTLDLPFEPLRNAARTLGGTFNDLYIAAAATAVQSYLAAEGEQVDALRLTMPVNLRGSGDAAANRFAPTRVLLDLHEPDRRRRFRSVANQLRSLVAEPVLGSVEFLSAAAAPLPTSVVVAWMRDQAATIDFAAANLRGSPIPLAVCGAPILANYAFGPRSGVPINLTLFTYDGRVQIAANTDPASVPHPDELMTRLREALEAFLTA